MITQVMQYVRSLLRGWRIDDLKEGEDNTDLNSNTTRHGLMPKLSGSAQQYFGGDGQWYDIPLGVNWYLTDAASDLAGFKALTTTVPTEAKASVAVAITAADTPIEEWAATAAETPPLMNEQVMHVHLHYAKTAGTKEAKIYAKFFHRTSGGTETLLGTSEMSADAPASEGDTDLSIAIPTTVFASTDRGVMRIFGTPSGTGTDPTVTIYYRGTTYSRVEGSNSLPTHPADLTFTDTQRVAGRNTAGAGAGEEVTLSQLLDWVGSAAEGDILYRGASTWSRLAKGTSGYVLSIGASAPSWIKLGQGFLAYAGSNQTLGVETYTKITVDTESFDSEGWFDKDTNYRFTPQVAGTYLIGYSVLAGSVADTYYAIGLVYKNGSPVSRSTNWKTGSSANFQTTGTVLLSMNGSSDYVEMYGWCNDPASGSGRSTIGGSIQYCYFWAVRVA